MTATAGEQAGSVYLDSCVLLSLFLGDSGFDASETWLLSRDGTELWISHWVLLEFAGVVATCVRRGQLTAERARCIESEFECFRQERLRLLEPRGSDFLQARQWLQQSQDLPLRSGDALHLALAKRHKLTLASTDRSLGQCAQALDLPLQLIG
ncbi:type II toxin-antitoxin system VapC family toxin [Synechococcus sp. CS-1331]|uniref:type II toxin-antitoxin system VapC family toxin n=1 Tax=Synechococcus sp. CS-1331 TaxID=2847973 RepID=UPI00223ACCDE|nr:type II toxin-antitoxin system VapC family toxin [Synechococcus sp. CS-1331]MCT0228380.1 type II toxin-antitoxin system VapC family toxin [Synechococcus sp. CS-1331]